MRILVTRAADQAEATAARLAAAGHEAVVAPLTRVVFDHAVALPLDGVGALIATSTNGVEALAGRADLDVLRRLPLFVVGARTARAARDLGFADVQSADGDRSDLVRLIAATRDPAAGRLLWLAGRDRTEIFATDLVARGFAVDVAELYRAEEVRSFPPEVAAELRAGKIDAIAVYSPRSGALILSALTACGFSPASPGPSIHAISEAAARGFRAVWRADVVVAARPDEAALTETFDRPRTPPTSGAPDDRPTDEIRRSRMAPKRTRGTVDTTTEGAAENPISANDPIDTTAPEADASAAAAEPAPETVTDAIPPEPTEPSAPEATEAAVEPAAAQDGATEPPVAEAAPEPAPVPTDEVPPAPVPPAAPANTGTSRLVAAAVIAALAGGGLGVGGSLLLARAPTNDRAALEAEISSLKTQVSGLAEVKTRLDAAEAKLGAAKPADLSAVEDRLAKIEAAPALTLPADAAQRLAALEDGAKARLDAAKTSVSEALANLPPAAQTPALQDLAAKVDAALSAARESAAEQTARLEAEVARLSAAAQAQGAGAADQLKASVAATTAQIAAEVDKRNAEIAAALDGLRQRLGGIEGLRGEVDGLIGRLGGLETSNKEAKVDRGRITETIDATLNGAESRVGKVESKLADLQAGAEAARQAQADAVLAVALADLKSAVDSGRPFRGEFEVVKRAAPADGLKLDAVAGFADTGVPTVARLRDQMPAVLRAMHEAEDRRTGGDGIFERLWSHAGQAIRIRPAGESAGTDLGALVSKVEARMIAGDLPAALTAWKALPDTARKVSETWGKALEARVDVDAALAAQTSAVVSKLSQPRP